MKIKLRIVILLSIFTLSLPFIGQPKDIMAEQKPWRELLNESQKEEAVKLTRLGLLHDDNIDDVLRRFSSSPPGTSIHRLLDTSFGANVARAWHGIKKGFADPTIDVKVIVSIGTCLFFLIALAITYTIVAGIAAKYKDGTSEPDPELETPE